MGFVNGGYDILWYKYLKVATSPCGGFGGPPPRKCRNMKCSRSDSMTNLGLLRATLCSESNIFFIDKNIIFSTKRWGGGSGPPDPLDPPLSSLLMKPQAKIDKIYLSVFEEIKNPK